MNWLRDLPIRRKLTLVIVFTCSMVLLLACGVMATYEVVEFRENMVRDTSVLADVLAKNTQAALTFQDESAARQTLLALQAEPNIISACLYDEQGNRFADYKRNDVEVELPAHPSPDGHYFESTRLSIFRPVILNDKRIGTLYLQSGLEGLYRQLRLFASLAAMVLIGSVLVALVLSSRLQRPISQPILSLAEIARSTAENKDYTVRVPSHGRDEIGKLTDAFNQLLASIEERDRALRDANDSLRQEIAERKSAEERAQSQLTRLELLHRITRAISERQDLKSIFQVAIRTLEEHLPLDFAGICLYEQEKNVVKMVGVGVQNEALAEQFANPDSVPINVDQDDFSRCIRGELVYEPDISSSVFGLFKQLASAGQHSVVAAPLLVESKIFGILIASRNEPHGFTSGDCEFLRQLSEHVALAAHQTQLYEALHQAYDDLRQTQQAVMQQERLRALGQMASGIAHDINNAISPVALYTESLLESEPGLSERARQYLETIQRAIDDVAQTVSRMKEFYRQREPQLTLAPVQLNPLIQQVIDLSRARWSTMSQQRGIAIAIETDLASNLPSVMGIESEIREALINLVFNAIDAMPDGGKLTLRSKLARTVAVNPDTPAANQIQVEIIDTGIGMDEDTRRRCLEPFFTTKGERGTGLGLAMVYGIARRHNAEIEIDSTLGVGTTVRFVFPVPEAAVAVPSADALPFTIPTGLRILVVDDDPMLLKSLRDALEMDGHSVVTTSGGREGIDAFRQAHASPEPFGVVITDLGMPYVNGREVSAAIKGMAPTTPIILLTGWGQRLVAEGDVPPHVDRILNKPPRLRDIRETLFQLISAKS